MSSLAKITRTAPVLLVNDVVRSAAYYDSVLGFPHNGFFGVPPSFCICKRDGFDVMLAQVPSEASVVPHDKVRPETFDAYFWIDDAAALLNEVRARGAVVEFEPVVREYGIVEFGVRDPDGHLLVFGQAID